MTTQPHSNTTDQAAVEAARKRVNEAEATFSSAVQSCRAAKEALREILTPFRDGQRVRYTGPVAEFSGKEYSIIGVWFRYDGSLEISARPMTKAGRPALKGSQRFQHGYSKSKRGAAGSGSILDADHLILIDAG